MPGALKFVVLVGLAGCLATPDAQPSPESPASELLRVALAASDCAPHFTGSACFEPMVAAELV